MSKSSKKAPRIIESDDESEEEKMEEDNSESENEQDDEMDESDNDYDEAENENPTPKQNSNKKATISKKRAREASSSDEDSDSSDNEDHVSRKSTKSKTKAAPPTSTQSTKKSNGVVTKKKSQNFDSTDRVLKSKELRKVEKLDEARKAYKWWEAEELPNGIQWRKLEHTGVVFPPTYEKHNVPFYYDGKPVHLTVEQEEVATFYAAMPEDGPQLGNPKTRTVFQNNFFKDFQELFPPGHIVKSFAKCDFSRIREHLELQKSLKKAATTEEKSLKKADKESIMEKQGFALIDGRIEKMGNYNMEPPGLFRGRGEHPKTGCLKKRCVAESVSINLSVDSCIPKCNLPGHAWQSVRHDPAVTWLCCWQENVQNSTKYVMLAASSSFKGKSDLEKYNKAIKLKGCIHKVRKDYASKIKCKNASERQLGTAMWVIDVLALRVGGEKGEDEADTVGCCSLRVEHLTFNPDPNSFEIELEFLGKDSMLYKQNINFAIHGDLGKQVYHNLHSFCLRKDASEDVFDTLTPAILNKHLTQLMKGLTAKVFRTFNASITLEKELPTAVELEGLTVQEKITRYNAANRQVAILCNHQKTVSKAAETMFENLNEKLETLKKQRDELQRWKDWAHKGKGDKIPLKEDDQEQQANVSKQLKEATLLRESAITNEEKLAATAAIEAAKLLQKQDQKRRLLEKHMFRSTPTEQSLEAKITKWVDDIRRLEVDIRNRDENKEVALGTSKINYMDPRITVAWCKRCEVPIDKVFARTLRDKFNWAMAVPPSWKFE